MQTGFLVPIKRSGDASPLYFVPSAGTTVFSLLQLTRTMQCDSPVFAFELSNVDSGIEDAQSVREIAALFAAEIRSHRETGPYIVAGHCIGGIIAFEIAAQLETAGETVSAVLLLEAVPPGHDATNEAGTDQGAATAKAVAELCDNVRDNLSKLDTKIAARFGPLSWKLIKMSETYEVGGAVKSPVLMVRTQTHPEAVFESWQKLTESRYGEQIVPGNAFSMLTPPAVAITAKKIDSLLQSLS